MALARGAGADGLGAFTIAFTVYLLVLGFQRALVSEPLHALPIGRECGTPGDDEHAVGASLVFSITCAVPTAVAGLLLARPALTMLALVLPLIVLQDTVRYVAFRHRRAQVAALVDGIWVVASLVAWPVVSSGDASVAVAAWAFGAAVGGLAGARLLRVPPKSPVPAIRWWWSNARRLGSRLALAGIVYTVTDQLAILCIAFFVADGALGELRGGQIIVQPALMLISVINVFMLPRLAGRDPSNLYGRLSGAISVSVTAISTIILLVTLLLLDPVRSLLFGGRVPVRLAVVLPLAVRTMASSASVGFVLALKADHRGDAFVGARLVAGLIGLIAVVGATSFAGIVGAAWGTAVQGGVYLAMMIRAWMRAGRQEGAIS